MFLFTAVLNIRTVLIINTISQGEKNIFIEGFKMFVQQDEILEQRNHNLKNKQLEITCNQYFSFFGDKNGHITLLT